MSAFSAILEDFDDSKKNLLNEIFSVPLNFPEYGKEGVPLADRPHSKRWKRITTEVLTPVTPFHVHKALYNLNYEGCADYHSPAWLPSQHRVTNIEQIMAVKGLKTYQQFYEWSINPNTSEEYWDYLIKNRLHVQFEHPYERVFTYDEEHGVKSVKYLAGARLNVADSCFPRKYLENPETSPPAVIFASENETTCHQWTHQFLHDYSSRIAHALVHQVGVKVGDAVGICMPMSPESVAIYLGIVRAGCAVVSIADSFSALEIATRMKLANASVIFTQDVISRGGKSLPLYERVVQAEPGKVVLVPIADNHSIHESVKPRAGDLNMFEILPPSGTPFNSVIVDSDHICNVLFSSGTTGEPKAIPWFHSTPIKSAIDGHVHQDVQPGDVVCWPTNLGWMMGPWILFQIMNGGTLALYNGVSTTAGFLKFVEIAKINMLGVVPSIVKAWKSIIDKSADGWVYDWSSITRFSSTGEASDAESMLWLMSRPGCASNGGYAPVIEYCGGTEIAGSFLSSTMLQPNIPTMFSTPVCGSRVCILSPETGVLLCTDHDIPSRVGLGENLHHCEGSHDAHTFEAKRNGHVLSDNADKTLIITGEIALVPPSLGLSTRLLNRDHHECYYEGMMATPDGRVLRRHGDEIQNLPGSYYRALGRCDDTMNLGGIKVSSVEIERVCNSCQLPLSAVIETSEEDGKRNIIGETAAIAIRPVDGGPSVLVMVVMLTPVAYQTISGLNNATEVFAKVSGLLKSTLQNGIKSYLNPLFHISDIVIADSLPRTASNKLMRRILRDDYMAKQQKPKK